MANPSVSICCYSGDGQLDSAGNATLNFAVKNNRAIFSHPTGTSKLLVTRNRFDVVDFRKGPQDEDRIRILVIHSLANEALNNGMVFMGRHATSSTTIAPHQLLVVVLRTEVENSELAKIKEALEHTKNGFNSVKEVDPQHPSEREFYVWSKKVEVTVGSVKTVPPVVSKPVANGSTAKAKKPPEKKRSFGDIVCDILKWLFCIRFCKKTSKV